MHALKDMPISFPGLFGDWEFNPNVVAIDIGNGIYWYGIILAFAMLAGLFLALRQCKYFGITEDHVMDLVLWAIPSCIVGSRIYYILFYLDLYRNADGSLDWAAMFRLWDGGLAIYGTVIAGVIVLFIFAKCKHLKFTALTDLGAMGLILGQCIGRWANFINREAFGGLTDLPWRMRLWTSATQSIEVHPTFLYESLWNLVGLLILVFAITKHRRFDGENTCFYFLWYGIGRFWIEGLRTDSLYLFDWTFQGEPIRVSQALSLALFVVAVVALVWNLAIKKHTPEELYVNQLAAAKAAAEAAAETAAAEETAKEAAEESGEAAAEGSAEDVPAGETPAEETAAEESAEAEAPVEEPSAEEKTVEEEPDNGGEA